MTGLARRRTTSSDDASSVYGTFGSTKTSMPLSSSVSGGSAPIATSCPSPRPPGAPDEHTGTQPSANPCSLATTSVRRFFQYQYYDKSATRSGRCTSAAASRMCRPHSRSTRRSRRCSTAGSRRAARGRTYCPGDNVARSQMAIFIAKGIAGGGAGTSRRAARSASRLQLHGGGVSLFSDVAPTDIFCKHVHYIAAKNVTSGCRGQVLSRRRRLRLEMASFIARAGRAAEAAIPLTYGPDPVTGLSYSCDAGSPNIHFTDVPATDTFCKHVHFLWAKGIIAGCSSTTYCPTGTVSRDQMAKFLVNAFALSLYGP